MLIPAPANRPVATGADCSRTSSAHKEQHVVDDGEDDGGERDADAEHRDGRRRIPARTDERTECVAKLPHGVSPHSFFWNSPKPIGMCFAKALANDVPVPMSASRLTTAA